MHCSSKDSLHLFRFSMKNHATVHFNQNLFICERSSLIQKLLWSDQINQTAFICQNNKREFSLVLGHVYMSTTHLPVYNAFLLTVMWREISYHGHDQNKFPGFSPQGLPLTIPTKFQKILRSEVLLLVAKKSVLEPSGPPQQELVPVSLAKSN